jgi:hypothetical protein
MDSLMEIVQTSYQLASQGIVMNCLEKLSAATLDKNNLMLFEGNLVQNQIDSSKH